MKVSRFLLCTLAGVILLLLMCMLSISLGAADMEFSTAWGAIFHFDSALTEHQIVRTFRVPRTVADIMVGSSLALCGAIMQGTTRNPLADSGLMGISSGAIFAIAVSMAFLPGASYGSMMLFACMGAALTTGLTYFIASFGKRGMTSQRLVLGGMSISMLFGAFSQFIALKYQLGESLMYWTAGGTAGAVWNELLFVAPIFIVGVIASIMLSPFVAAMSLGEEVASGLGLKTKSILLMSTIIVLVLTGLSVIVVGPVGFVGLIIPHIVRRLVGVDYRYIIPVSGLYGALLTVAADLAGRLINKPYETPIGVTFAVIGVPYFLYLVRKQKRGMDGI